MQFVLIILFVAVDCLQMNNQYFHNTPGGHQNTPYSSNPEQFASTVNCPSNHLSGAQMDFSMQNTFYRQHVPSFQAGQGFFQPMQRATDNDMRIRSSAPGAQSFAGTGVAQQFYPDTRDSSLSYRQSLAGQQQQADYQQHKLADAELSDYSTGAAVESQRAIQSQRLMESFLATRRMPPGAPSNKQFQ